MPHASACLPSSLVRDDLMYAPLYGLLFFSLVFFSQVIANMTPFRENEDGTKGDKLPQIASGEGVDIVLETGRCARAVNVDC